MLNDTTLAVDPKWLDLSMAQQAVWLDAKLSGSSVYQLGGWARIAAPLDEAAVRQSVSLIMARHDALRLRVDDELPRQWLDESVEPPIAVFDLSVDKDPDQAFHSYVEDVFASALPLGDQPLFRIELIRAGANLNYLLWRFHHLIADSATVLITLDHWFKAYEALTSGTPGDLAPPSSYSKTIAADASYLESAAYQRDLAYWTARFESMPPALIADMEARPSRQRKVPYVDWTLAGDVYRQLQDSAKAAGTTVQRALFALFALALGRRYGQSEVVSGVALHRRDLANRHVIGMMAGVIAVRCKFEPHWSLEECVQAFSEQVDADLRHQRLPVDILSRSLGLAGTGRAGLFEVAMSYIPADRGDRESALEGLPVLIGAVATKEASPISLHVKEQAGGEGVLIRVAVNADFLDSAEAASLLALFGDAHDRLVSSPETRFEDLATVTAAERDVVVQKWNQTEVPFEAGTLDALFAAQARRTPESVAVVGRDGIELTYAELDARSTRLARYLVAQGVYPERVVGVRMERCSETIIALLAILKAGGVYLPLDPSYPPERLKHIATDAGAILVLESINGLDADAELPHHSDANRLAYIIYTSGTTGLPKGVAVSHSAPVNLAWARRACHDPLGVGDRVLAGISVGFDVSIGQLLLPLLCGASVVIAGDLKTMGAAEFWELLARRRVSHVNSVPSFLDSILDAAPPVSALTLKRLMLGGEALSGALVRRIEKALPGVEVVNMYGPTEACIDATFHVATPEDLSAAVLPIGKPLANYSAYVLNDLLEPVGIGVSGELYLGGAGLARGYVNALDLTAERFVADPFSGIPGARLYRTGDRARWRTDGCIEFLGRVDQQVKIRGFRVEPGEISAALLGHPGIGQAVVVARSQPGAQTRLIAYVVPRSSAVVPDTSDLRAFLAQRLPEYMVPSAFVPIGQIPLNRNGKLDENALPSPDLREGEYVAPRTPTEEAIARLFAEVLGLERCGATDNFFELGGHSLLATSLVSRMRGLGIAVPLQAVFEAPSVAALASRVDTLLPAVEAMESITARPRPAELPLSFPQERIWFVDRMQQDGSYNIPVALEFLGKLDVSALDKAIGRMLARHESLRTRIVLCGSRPVQEILPNPDFVLERVNFESEETLQRYLTRLAAHRFDLSAGLPFQAALIAMEAERHILAMVIHHVAFDGWSASVFLREFAALYAAFKQRRPDPLPLSTLQYADFALWQREQNRDTDLAYWLHELKDAPPTSELPGDSSNGKAQKPVESLSLHIKPELYASLGRLARDHGASLFMVLHAAFALVLSRWSGQDDVVVGTVVANRNRRELEEMIGCFVNTLPLRTTLERGESFTSLLARVKNSDLGAFAHQDLPFEQLVEALQPERSLQHTPIFQVMLVLQNAPTPIGEFDGLAVQAVPIRAQAPQFDLSVTLTAQDGGITGAFEFATSRFQSQTIERFANHFRRVLEGIVENAGQDASRIGVLDSVERELILDQCSGEVQRFPRITLEALFAEQVQANPNAVAVVGSDGSELTYVELDAQSTRLARYLTAHGVCPERAVGVRMERSTETIIAFLAILKAGGVYLPLDPSYPAERLEFMIADAGAMLVLDSLPEMESETELPRYSDANRLAYIIYTSGTTGRPKGVAVPQSAAVNLVFARSAGYDPLGPGDRVLAVTSVSFDMSIEQLLFPLMRGATVVIAGDVRILGASGFWELLVSRRVSHIDFVPSFVESILYAAPAAGQVPLKRLMLGGEAVSGALLDRIRKTLPDLEVVNVYGPTETCIDATYHVTTAEDVSANVLPIGRPLLNYRAYILDDQMDVVGIGIVGELYVEGRGLARCYVGAPELTAQRFVANPFSKEPGARLYRTGDRARWRPDGSIEFVGRADHQVKVRGFRVELGEIETELRKQPGVREVAVIAQATSGGTRLIAYFTGEEAPEIEALRSGMAVGLPDYMVPAAFVKLDRLPLSPNGKLDRKGLPNPDQSSYVAREFAAPVGEIEQKMSALWAELLKLERVGRHDNFFELGGHSLLAVSLIERMKQQGLPGDVRALFATPTVAGLAATASPERAKVMVPENRIPRGCSSITPDLLSQVELTQWEIDGIVRSVPGGASNVQDIYPLSPLQEGILFQHRASAAADPYLTPFLLAFDARGRLDNFVRALNQVVERHDVLRTAVIWQGLREPVQVVWRHATIAVEEVTIDSAEQLTGRFNPHRLDLTKAPLVRAIAAYDYQRSRWLLLMLTHHLVVDHTGMEILVRELRALMDDPRTELPTPLPYRNFIAATRSGPTREEQRAFFTQMLRDVEYPTAPFGLLDVQSNGGETKEGRLTVEPRLARKIREHSRSLGVTPASLFHLAWAAVLSHICGKSDVVFGTVLFGRMSSGAGADRMVGMFINTLPIRVNVDQTAAAKSVVQTHRLLAELMAHEHAPLTLAQRCSAVVAPAPLFSSLFNYRYSPSGGDNTQWLGVEMLTASERTSYPLAMAIDDSSTDFILTALTHPLIEPVRVCRYLERTLSGLVDLLEREPQAAIQTLQVLPRTERHMVLEEWNRTETKFANGTLDNLFCAQTRRTPNSLAVIGRDGAELTYAELDAQSTRLARQLAARGVNPGHVVGVRMERSSGTIIALLAILKAGGVYLPLDPSYPPERLDYMAADAGAVLVLDSIHGTQGDAELPQLTDPNRLAYIIYTSGTTGRPKGVAVSHSAPVNLAFARRACHDAIGPGDRILAAISVGFDVSIGQLLLPLLSGATVVVAEDLKTMGATEFWAMLAERRVSHINSVPSFFDSILDAAPVDGQLALKRLMLGGEPLSGALVSRIRRALPGVEVVNMYGPTEACIDATFHVATVEDLSEAVLPIGQPLANYRAYVLDQRMEPVGIGVTGELYLGGAGLACGYVNAPELTAERFVTDPFSATFEGKLYKTGDRARWRADGQLEFLGRVDEQVKIRGFRVEPAEIEAQLKKQPGVRDAAVIARNAVSGTQLIAYYTSVDSPEIDALRLGMAAAVPDYMVPSAFVRLDQLPLSANGKLDRKALPDPGQEAFVSRAFEPPVGEIETKMAALWKELLKVERVGRQDNFFELGGHSLLAVTLIERLQQQGLPGDVRTLFTTPTIAGLAACAYDHSSDVSAPDNGIVAGAATITPAMLPLAKLTQEQIDRIVATVPGGASNVQDIYPLAPLQEGILFQYLLRREGDPYLAPFLLGFDTRERLDSFLESLKQLVQRHDVLRTAIVWQNLDQPLQVVLREVNIPVEEVSAPDAAALFAGRFNPQVFRLDLSKAPLLHTVAAFDSHRGRWLLLMLTHHLILDHTSMEIVVGELRALMTDPQVPLPLALPYRNFVAQTINGTPRDEHEAFFTRLVGDVSEPTAPFGLLDIQTNDNAITEGELELDSDISVRIRERARKLGVTPASLFHVAWAAVLGFVSGKSDVVFGTVLLGRMRSGAGADRVVGMFINTLPMRIQLDHTGAAQSVAEAQRLLAELMAHEHAPLALAQRCSGVPAPAPLFSSLLNYRHNFKGNDETPWPGVEMLHSSERTNYPVAMAVDDSGAGFTLRALAQPVAGSERLCQYLREAVTDLVDLLERAPETPIQTLRVLPQAERSKVVEEWNNTEATFDESTLDGLFSRQARRSPEALAIIGPLGKELTYGDLDERSTKLARYLVSQGVSPEHVVGVRMERSADTVIAFLAILKAGGVYLPLDPAYPADRLDYMAADARALLVLDSIEGLEGDADLPCLSDAGRLAYIIYTSGTTGRPKGVAVPHSAPVNLAFARRACHDPLGPGDRVLAAISVGFDVSIGQLLLPLLSGASIVIAADLKAMGASEFWAFLESRCVTHVNSVPSFFDSVLDVAPAAGTLALKRLMLGGEALSGALVSRIQRALPGVEVVNMYGPTETCIDATFHIAEPTDLAADVLPIGRPLKNYKAYILNSHLTPVGVGVAGELYLGGAGLARGYVNAPELTVERFVANPFSSVADSKLYRTGDRARWRADGEIEFLGRMDAQVKIRGFRVEPGEIEAQLRKQPTIREAVVAYYEFGDTQISIREAGEGTQTRGGDARLVAYYTGDHAPSVEELRADLAAVLPDYMVPSAFIKLDRLPLSPNGKLDRKALPRDIAHHRAHAYEGPRNSTQTVMQEIFQTVLGVHPIGIHDNFFSVGGHSLAAMRLINACNTQFKTSLALRTLFENPTIAQLSDAIVNVSARGSRRLIPLQPAGAKRNLFCIHPAGGYAFCYLPLVRELGLQQPVFAFQASGLEEGEPLAESIEQTATEYIDAIHAVQPEGPYQLLGMSSGGLIAYEMARQIRQRGGEVSFLALLDTTVPGSMLESAFTESVLLRAIAGELGCVDLMKDAAPDLTLEQLVQIADNAGRLPAGFTFAHAERISRVFRNAVHLSFAYGPAKLSGPMLLLRAMRRDEVGEQAPDWTPFVGDLEKVDLDCAHEELVSEALASTVAAIVAKHMEK
jgi:amino acid adenylation domain-containing protein